jgi:hypothetical protein
LNELVSDNLRRVAEKLQLEEAERVSIVTPNARHARMMLPA